MLWKEWNSASNWGSVVVGIILHKPESLEKACRRRFPRCHSSFPEFFAGHQFVSYLKTAKLSWGIPFTETFLLPEVLHVYFAVKQRKKKYINKILICINKILIIIWTQYTGFPTSSASNSANMVLKFKHQFCSSNVNSVQIQEYAVTPFMASINNQFIQTLGQNPIVGTHPKFPDGRMEVAAMLGNFLLPQYINCCVMQLLEVSYSTGILFYLE